MKSYHIKKLIITTDTVSTEVIMLPHAASLPTTALLVILPEGATFDEKTIDVRFGAVVQVGLRGGALDRAMQEGLDQINNRLGIKKITTVVLWHDYDLLGVDVPEISIGVRLKMGIETYLDQPQFGVNFITKLLLPTGYGQSAGHHNRAVTISIEKAFRGRESKARTTPPRTATSRRKPATASA